MLDALAAKRLPSRPRMTRAILTSLLVGMGLLVASALPGCKDEGVGDPCTPEQEYDPSFIGFDEKEVNVESKSFQCRTRICLVNHFRGRASCPYGQNSEGINLAAAKSPEQHAASDGRAAAPSPARPTRSPASRTPADPTSFRDPRKKALVAAAVRRPHGRQGRLLLVPLRRHQRRQAERSDVLRLPGRLLVHAARHVDRCRQRRPHRLVLHQGQHGVQQGHGLQPGRLRPDHEQVWAVTAPKARLSLSSRPRGRSGRGRQASGERLPGPLAEPAHRRARARSRRQEGRPRRRRRGARARSRLLREAAREHLADEAPHAPAWSARPLEGAPLEDARREARAHRRGRRHARRERSADDRVDRRRVHRGRRVDLARRLRGRAPPSSRRGPRGSCRSRRHSRRSSEPHPSRPRARGPRDAAGPSASRPSPRRRSKKSWSSSPLRSLP